MHIRSWVGVRLIALFLIHCILAVNAVASAQAVPPKNTWRISSSGVEREAFGATNAVDGDVTTRWSSPFEDGHWLIIDTGVDAVISGLVLRWESAYASAYRIELSRDGEDWRLAHQTDQGDGELDYIFIEPTWARYCRITCVRRATGWGASLWEVDLLDAEHRPVIMIGGVVDPDAADMLDGRLDTMSRAGGKAPETTIEVDFKTIYEVSGLRIDWGKTHADHLTAQSSSDGQDWTAIGEVDRSSGEYDLILGVTRPARFLRLTLARDPNEQAALEIRELKLRGPGEQMHPLALYKLAAAKAGEGLYPPQLTQQSFWTLVGLPRDFEESLLDEFGNFEARTAAPMVMPMIQFHDGPLLTAQHAASIEQWLEDGHLPLPGVRWRLADLELAIEAVAAGETDASMTYVRYQITNTSDKQRKGRLLLTVRPCQVNPAWQHGGLAPIHQLTIQTNAQGVSVVQVNAQPLLAGWSRASKVGATSFENGDIARWLARESWPTESQAADDAGLASGVLAFDFDLAPGAAHHVVLAAPLHGRFDHFDGIRTVGEASDQFDQLKALAVDLWRGQLASVTIELPDREITDTLKAQVGYILLNQDGDAIQPGSRNYNRSWMRDGSITALALLRLGMTAKAQRYIEWYAQHITTDGLVPPILNNDGSVNTGFGADLEYDSQGQFVFLAMSYYRLTHDWAFLEKHFEKMIRALHFTRSLRLRTLRADYLPTEPGRERFQGILPPSISHEGYSQPVHSYWDDYWALKGWLDGRDAARALGEDDVANWCQTEYDQLRLSVARSIERTTALKRIDYLPASADLGDPDPTSLSIALFPCGQGDMLPRALLEKTFDAYYRDTVLPRLLPGARYSYTPYEVRNIMSFAMLNQPTEADVLLSFLMQGRYPAGWRGFAEVVHSDKRSANYIGDTPHTWVGSGYVNTVLGLIFVEGANRLELFNAMPASWWEGEGLRLRHVPTNFGLLGLRARIQNRMLQVDIEAGLRDLDEIFIAWPAKRAVAFGGSAVNRPTLVTVDGQVVSSFDDHGVVISPRAKQMTASWE